MTLATPDDLDRVSSFLNIRVADIDAVYCEWSKRGAEFLTPPKQPATEIRCHIRDPDGYLIEVGKRLCPEAGDHRRDRIDTSSVSSAPASIGESPQLPQERQRT